MKKFTLNLKMCIFFSACAAFCLFSGFNLPEDSRTFIHDMLNRYYDKDVQNAGLKRYELNVTNTGLCRYRKVYLNGKEEYFAFNLSKFKDMDFYGNTTKGNLFIRTQSDNVMVQTRRDKAGEVDSMSTYIVIPLKNIEVAQLNELLTHFKQLNNTILATSK
jgi:hypothetical protein